MDTINILFIIMSIFALGYVGYSFKKQRVPLLLEFVFLGMYGLVLFVFVFPNSLQWIERTLGIPSAINLFLYLGIFVAYLLLFVLYRKTESQREEITTLTREIAKRK